MRPTAKGLGWFALGRYRSFVCGDGGDGPALFWAGSLARDFNDEKEGKEKSKREKRADGSQFKGRGSEDM